MPAECRVCLHENQADIEALALKAKAGDITWAEVNRQLPEFSHVKGIQNHMERHYQPPVPAADIATGEFDDLIEQSFREMLESARLAPPDIRPLILTAAHNFRGLRDTKASQQQLINALKTVHDIAGMKVEQKLMLDFAKHAFGTFGPKAVEVIEQHTNVIDVEETADV